MAKKSVLVLLISTIFAFFLGACQSTPKKFDNVNEGQWEGRVLIKDKRKNQSHVVSVDINAIKDEKIRINVTAAMGTPVAALVVDGAKTQYILFKQKAFYEGATQPKVLNPVLAIEMDPRLLFSVLFDSDIKDTGWLCLKDEKNFLKTCENRTVGLKIDWVERKGEKRTVKIDHANASLQLNLNSFRPKVVARDDLFSLKAPSGFKTNTMR